MRFERLADWLRWQESLHPRAVELGLTRCRRVLGKMGLLSPAFRVITVGGTNGKGSCVAMIEAMLRALGHHTGVFTSPHLSRYNERIRLDGKDASDDMIMAAFSAVDTARGTTSLTYFEFATIAALYLFADNEVDTAVMEVGLGGRLDASNSVNADVAVITSLSLDHQEWLGNTLAEIAMEKAGIMREGKPVVCGEPEPPVALIEQAIRRQAKLYRLGHDFYARRSTAGAWDFSNARHDLRNLPLPAMAGDVQISNAACAIQALCQLDVDGDALEMITRDAMATAVVDGRFQRFNGTPSWILDVAHNPAAAEQLAGNLAAAPCSGTRRLLMGLLADKDAAGFASALKSQVTCWYAVDTNGDRALPAESLAGHLRPVLGKPEACFDSVARACEALAYQAGPADQIVVTGSFSVVGPALDWLRAREVNQGGFLDTMSTGFATRTSGSGNGTAD